MKTTSIGNLNMKNAKMFRTLLAAVALALPAVAPATTLAPDAGNYSATDQTPFSFVDISGGGGGGTSVLSGVDDSAVALTLPFSFNFYGTAYTQVCVSSNGVLYFITDAATCSTTTGDFAHIDLNSGAPAPDLPAIYAYWTDLTFQDTGAGSVFYQTLGTAGSRRFIVQWNTALPQGDTSGVTFEAILTEGANAITLQYQTVSLGAGDNNRNGRTATVGIHNTNGFAQAKQQEWSYNAAVLTDGTALQFQASAPSATTLSSPANGATGVALPVSLTWNTAIGAGTYDVYFGTTATPPLVQADTTLTNYSVTAAPTTTYYWQIVSKNGAGTAASPVFSFTTAVAAPGAPALSSPGNGAAAVASPVSLSWSAAAGAATYDVYFGTSATPPLVQADTTSTNYSATTAAGSTYYWKIVSKNGGGSAASPVYSFTTAVASGGGGGSGGSGGGGGGGGSGGGTSPTTLSPAEVTLNAAVGTTAATQTVTLSYQTFTQGAPSFLTSANTNQGVGWLTVTPGSGTMTEASHVGTLYTYSVTLTVKGDPTGIADGSSYTGRINITAAGGLNSLPVTMNVAKPAALTLAPADMTLNAAVGTTSVTQTVTASYQTSTQGAPAYQTSASTNQGQGWLTVTPASGTMTQTSHVGSVYTYSATFTVKGDPTGIPDGSTYTGKIDVTASGAIASLPVTLKVATAAPLPQPTGGIANAASGGQAVASVVTPGSYVAIYGTDMADTGDPNAKTLPLPLTLNGAQVTLCGVPVPLLYASATQINVLLPQTLPSATTCPLVVTKGTVPSAAVTLTVTPLQPGIYTVNTSGSGPGIVTNALTAQLNDANHPAQASDYLVIYMTGLGQVVGPNGEAGPADGAAAPTDKVFQTVAKVTATIGGVPAPVVFSGLTPTLAGLYQVNVQLPQGVTPGNAVPVIVTATNSDTGATAQSNTVTIVVQ